MVEINLITFLKNNYLMMFFKRLHKFSWHGQDEVSKVRFIANKNNFEILNFAPNQIYYNVDEVRTSDDALIRIKLMIFYELTSIQTMVNLIKTSNTVKV